jgi:ABC-type sugar transport system substrate-binding protein
MIFSSRKLSRRMMTEAVQTEEKMKSKNYRQLVAATAMAGAFLFAATNVAQADALGDFKTKVEAAFKTASEGDGKSGVSGADSPKLKAGVSIGAACLGSQITACVEWWAQLKDIAALTGWTVAEYDGKIDVATWNGELTRASQAGHAAILTFGAIPSISSEGLNAIATAKLPLVGMTSDDPEGVAAFTSRLDGGIKKDNFEVGYLQGVAAYTIGKGKINAIGGYDGSEISVARREGFEAFIAECVAAGGDCKANLRQTDTAQMFQQIGGFCSSLALANPDHNVLITQVDDLTAICVDEVKSAGLLKEGSFGVGVDFNAIGVKRISEGTNFLASVAAPYPSGAWQGVDELNRILNGGTSLSGRPWAKRIFHPGNIASINKDAGIPWDVQLFNPKAEFSKAWGIAN